MIERTKVVGGLFQFLCILACVLIIAMLVVILGNIVINGVGAISVDFLTKAPEAGMTGGGIFPAIFGTFALVVLMTIAVIPLGVATAIYMHEYAPKRSRIVHLVRLAIQNLAGVPAIVFGLFGLGFLSSLSAAASTRRFMAAT
jgi:phosphate transport system permease protein